MCPFIWIKHLHNIFSCSVLFLFHFLPNSLFQYFCVVAIHALNWLVLNKCKWISFLNSENVLKQNLAAFEPLRLAGGVKPFEVVPPSYWGSREFFVQRKKEMKINKTHLLRMKRNSTIQHGSKNGFTQSDNTELQSIKMSTEKKTIITDTKIFL